MKNTEALVTLGEGPKNSPPKKNPHIGTQETKTMSNIDSHKHRGDPMSKHHSIEKQRALHGVGNPDPELVNRYGKSVI